MTGRRRAVFRTPVTAALLAGLAGLAGLAVVAGVAAAGCTAVTPTDPSSTVSPVRTPSTPVLPTTAAPTTAAPTTAAPTTAAPTTAAPTSAPGTLRTGDSGPAVTAIQRRLDSVGYWLGGADGKFGAATQQAVIAFQKAAGLDRDGVVGPRTAAALATAARPLGRFEQVGIEIDLRRQLLLVVDRDGLTWAFNTSTGGGYVYSRDGERHVAVTPTGHFQVTRSVDGWDHSPLGLLWRPMYFNGGIAVHGYEEVPAFPASHGCVRVTVDAMNWLWTTGAMAVGTSVIVY